ncbi:hypothetical protein [Thiohalorhabdus methylotrophus]|uniref:Uncharacterized protein n=1 Tax=Thiohalorhabdus methylotrophus TaxID=3242694 RepID=A0ABV4TU01_9GAMM
MKTAMAFLANVAFTVPAVGGLVALGVGERHSEPLWAIGTAVALIAIFVANLLIFFKVAGNEPWKWHPTEND